MPASRKEIRAALLARLTDEVESVDEVTPREFTAEELTGHMPCIVLRGLGSAPEHEPNEPEIWRHGYAAIVYVRNSAKDGSTDDLLDEIVDEVHAALGWRSGEGMEAACTTLGGLCQYARISGEVSYEPGEASDQAAAIVPLEVLVAD